jgi:DNA-directed RNA polymerase beta' subunit
VTLPNENYDMQISRNSYRCWDCYKKKCVSGIGNISLKKPLTEVPYVEQLEINFSFPKSLPRRRGKLKAFHMRGDG